MQQTKSSHFWMIETAVEWWTIMLHAQFIHFHFASALVTVDPRHMTLSSSASCSSFSPPTNFVSGHMSTMWLTVCHRKVIGQDFIAKICPTRALICPETVEQRPCVTREIETWLLDSGIHYNRVVDDRRWRPVLSALRSCVDRCHVWPYWALRCKLWQWMFRDISVYRPVWVGFDDWSMLSVATLWRREGGATLVSTGSHEKCVRHKQPKIRRMELWSWVSVRFE